MLSPKKSCASFCLAMGLLSMNTAIFADIFNGPTDLSVREFKDLTINGPTKLNEIKADSLIIKGPLNFNKLKVAGNTDISGPCSGEMGEFKNVSINGPFWASKIKIENLNANSDVTIEDFDISGNTKIKGPLKAKNGKFNNIESVSLPVALYNVTVNNIHINQDSQNTDTEIKLAGETIVSGNIIFDSGNGVVFIRDKTVQFKGKVIGGTLKTQ